MKQADPHIEGLLDRARRGDEAALASLLGAVRDQVFRWALVITADSDDAEDVTQQVSLTIHRKLKDFQERSRFMTWVYAIVRNAAIESTRKGIRRQQTALNEETMPENLTPAIEQQIAQIDSRRAAAIVRSFFVDLPSRQRELIELMDNGGYNAAEAAEMMGIEPETARVHLLRARRAIRARMLEQHPELMR